MLTFSSIVITLSLTNKDHSSESLPTSPEPSRPSLHNTRLPWPRASLYLCPPVARRPKPPRQRPLLIVYVSLTSLLVFLLHTPLATYILMLPARATQALAANPPASQSNSALYNFKLLAALRSGNPSDVQPYLDELKAGPDGGAGRLLGMAVRVASGEFSVHWARRNRGRRTSSVHPVHTHTQTDIRLGRPNRGRRQNVLLLTVETVPIIKFILSSPNVSSPNLPVKPPSTTTALHVASEIGRPEAVALLLDDPRIDDTIRDDRGHTALECAANAEVAALIEGTLFPFQHWAHCCFEQNLMPHRLARHPPNQVFCPPF